ncbi:MAG: ABC transporter ATP-binding protein [Anaerolineales bacterium]|nr:ABC transporter ATP-binding protein [Anaerolineales bacterium]
MMQNTEEEKAANNMAVVRRLVQYLKPYWLSVLGAFVMILVTAFSQAIGPLLIGRAIDEFITVGDRTGLARIMLMLFGVYSLNLVGMRYQIYWMNYAGQNVLADLRAKIMKHIQSLSLQYLEGSEAGDLMSRLVNDVDTINTFFSQGISQMIGATFSLLGIVIAMFSVDWRLALATLAIVPVMLLTTERFSKMARQAFRRTRTTIGDVSADLQEELGGVKVAQAFNRTEENVSRFTERNAANRDANVQANAVTSAFAPAMDVLSTIDTAIVAGFGGYLAINGALTVGVVVAFLQYVQNFFRPINTVAQLWTVAQSAFAAAERVFDLLDMEPEITDAPDAIEQPEITGKVVFDNVTFGYDSDLDVLRNVNLEVEPGKMIAIVGPTGAGKSTMISLLPRFYDVDEGTLSIDGYDVRQVTQNSLRTQMGMVLQEPFLFSGTVMDNIRYGSLTATDEEVIGAAKAANAHEFIMRMPEGYATDVGERGNLLSLGQRQLISIARAILANPRILILDEATASVDTRTESLIQEALDHLLKGRTSFVIAHRLSTIRNADLVLVMDHGEVVERGTHNDLLRQGGLYMDLYNRQFYVPQEETSKEVVGQNGH